MSSIAVYSVFLRTSVFLSGICLLNAFFSQSLHFGRFHPSQSSRKAFQSLLDLQVADRFEPLFRPEYSLYQNKIESIRRVWEVIDSFGTSESSSDKTFSAKDFQDEAEYTHIKDIEVRIEHIRCRTISVSAGISFSSDNFYISYLSIYLSVSHFTQQQKTKIVYLSIGPCSQYAPIMLLLLYAINLCYATTERCLHPTSPNITL